MPAYLIARVRVQNPTAYEEYNQDLAVLDSVPRSVFQSPESSDLRSHFR